MGYDNEATQAERRAVLKNDTYFSRAQATIGDELGGRFKPLSKTVVVGVPQVPRQPPNSVWSGDVVPPEPPLGYSVHDMVPTGTPSEGAASIAAELQKAIEVGGQVARASPDDPPLKRRV
jgi:hypothetical protein